MGAGDFKLVIWDSPKKNIKIKDTLEKTIVIESGLQESDIVVTEGQIRIKDGITAKAKQ